MTDSAGRPTFEDGYNIARSLMVIDNYNTEKENAKRQKQIETESYAIAETLGQNPNADLSQYDNESRYMGRKLRWQADIDKTQMILNQANITNAGLQQERSRIQVYNDKMDQLAKEYAAARKSGNETRARQIGHQLYNMSPNGLHVKSGENGRLVVTGWEGNTEEMDDLPIEQYDEKVSSWLGMDDQEKIKMLIGNKQMNRSRNAEIMKQAEPYEGPNGEIAMYVPAGTYDPETGDMKGAFFTDAQGNELTDEQVKNFKPMSESVQTYYRTAGEMPDKPTRTAMAKAEGGLKTSTTDTRGSEEKYADLLSKAYGIPLAEAVDMVRTDKQLAQLLKAYNAELETKTEWETDTEKIASTEKELRAKYGLDEYFNKRSSMGGPTEGAADTSEAPPVEGAKKANDGKWYVKKDGKYYLVQ